MNIVDWIIIGLLLLGAIAGYKNGFIGTVVRACSSIIGLIVAYKYYADLEKWLDTKVGFKEGLGDFLRAHVTLPQAISEFKLENLLSNNVASYLDRIIPNAQIKTKMLEYLESLRTGIEGPLQISLADVIHQYLASAIMNVVAFLIIWLLIDLSLQLVARIFRGLIKDTILGQFDRFSGLIIGTLFTAIVLTVTIGLITPIFNLLGMAKLGIFSTVVTAIGQATLVPHFASAFTFVFSKFTMGSPI
ncbi:MAG: hypothetical protein CVU87_08305 [Firmicutes bacterium HGW-Firmicutes-12]|jgi:uncharacterized membrane protein required for colicin V production|nr:MAG: hypothetical protein CVU87_08305 [Firmicutes bacterium HGW-Firmicutes-12]